MPLILASTSLTRKRLFESLGLPFTVEAPGVEEDFPLGMSVEDAVALLSKRKASAVFERHPDALIIGSDQMALLDGQPLGKPADRTAARKQLQAMRGKAHQLYTGVCVIGPSFFECQVETASLTIHRLGDEEIERYLDLQEWVGCAGSYRIESAGQALFSSVEGDRTGIMGLPLTRLCNMLRRAGVSFFTHRAQ